MPEKQQFDPTDYLDSGPKKLEDNNYADLRGLNSQQIKQIALARIAARSRESDSKKGDEQDALNLINNIDPFDPTDDAITLANTVDMPTKPDPIDMGKAGIPIEAEKFGLTQNMISLLSRYGLNTTFQLRWGASRGSGTNDRIDIQKGDDSYIELKTKENKILKTSSLSLLSNQDNRPIPNTLINVEEIMQGDKKVLKINKFNTNTGGTEEYYLDRPNT